MNSTMQQSIQQQSIQPNLYCFGTYIKRYGATRFNFEWNRKKYQMAGEYNYGDMGVGVFVKIVRQYFAQRTSESNTVFFENIPISSLDDLQNINITFEFSTENDKLGFCYIIRNTDTNFVIAEDEREDVHLESYYKKEIDPNSCNICEESDYIFTEEDFSYDEWEDFAMVRPVY
jgi:hypothetical protein